MVLMVLSDYVANVVLIQSQILRICVQLVLEHKLILLKASQSKQHCTSVKDVKGNVYTNLEIVHHFVFFIPFVVSELNPSAKFRLAVLHMRTVQNNQSVHLKNRCMSKEEWSVVQRIKYSKLKNQMWILTHHGVTLKYIMANQGEPN